MDMEPEEDEVEHRRVLDIQNLSSGGTTGRFPRAPTSETSAQRRSERDVEMELEHGVEHATLSGSLESANHLQAVEGATNGNDAHPTQTEHQNDALEDEDDCELTSDLTALPVIGEDAFRASPSCLIPSLKFENWRVLWAVMITSGGQKITRHQYHAIRLFTDTADCVAKDVGKDGNSTYTNQYRTSGLSGRITSLPHHSTVTKKFKPLLYNHLTVRGLDLSVPVNVAKAGARASAYGDTGDPRKLIRIVLPSEYARADISTPIVFDLMRETSLHARQSELSEAQNAPNASQECVDMWPIVFAREFFYGVPKTF